MEPRSKKKKSSPAFFCRRCRCWKWRCFISPQQNTKGASPPIVSQMRSEKLKWARFKTAFFFLRPESRKEEGKELQTHCSAKIASLIFALKRREMRRCARKGHFFLLSFCGGGNRRRAKKASRLRHFFKDFLNFSSAHGKREDVRNLKMDGKEGISGRYRFPTAIIDASERGDFSLLFEAQIYGKKSERVTVKIRGDDALLTPPDTWWSGVRRKREIWKIAPVSESGARQKGFFLECQREEVLQQPTAKKNAKASTIEQETVLAYHEIPQKERRKDRPLWIGIIQIFFPNLPWQKEIYIPRSCLRPRRWHNVYVSADCEWAPISWRKSCYGVTLWGFLSYPKPIAQSKRVADMRRAWHVNSRTEKDNIGKKTASIFFSFSPRNVEISTSPKSPSGKGCKISPLS